MNFEGSFKNFFDISKDIEALFLRQKACIDLNFGFSDENNEYLKRMKQASTLMCDKGQSTEHRIKGANMILELIDFYENSFIKDLQMLNGKIENKLFEFDLELKETPKHEEKEYCEFLENINRWLDLSKDFHSTMVMFTNAIIKRAEIDKVTPQIAVNSGNPDSVLTGEESEKFMKSLLFYHSLCELACSRQKEISEIRDPLTKKLFGGMEKESEEEEKMEVNEPIDDTPTGDYDSFLKHFKSFSDGDIPVSIHQYNQIKSKFSLHGELTVGRLDSLVRFASNQCGMWKAEYLFSPADAPNKQAKLEADSWNGMFEKWASALADAIPDMSNNIKELHELMILRHIFKKGGAYLRDKPIQRFLVIKLSEIAIGLRKIGLDSMGTRLYGIAMSARYPKGSIGSAT